jgi:hypothetical protein
MAVVSFNSCSSTPEPVLINGVRWAICNVDQPGTFAAKPEDSGMFYQWNRKKAWATTGDEVTGWDASTPTGDSWTKENDPSPAGYRVPTRNEIKALLDTDKVGSEWTTVNGVTGRKFTDKTTGNSIFLPAVGNRAGNKKMPNYSGTLGLYGSSTAYDSIFVSGLSFHINSSSPGDCSINCNVGFRVRPVAE